MPILKSLLIIFTISLLISCNNQEKKVTLKVLDENTTSSTPVSLSKSEKILKKTITAHGGHLYETAQYAFVFRENTFQFKNDGSNYEYTKTYKKGNSEVKDVLKNGVFSRTINNTAVTLSEKDIASGSGAINSVIYFATLPYKLNDEAVNSKYIENISIKGENYDAIEVNFNQEGGGEDHDDEYYYWINAATKKIDYLAYNYSVNKGGVRFRAAYNKRVIDGITFQDYVNYEAPVGTALKDLPTLFEANQLKELSKIDTEDVVDLSN